MMENKEDYKIYSTVEKQEVEWLWYPYIPYGKLTLLQGDPGDGKSTFMINIASALTRGGKKAGTNRECHISRCRR